MKITNNGEKRRAIKKIDYLENKIKEVVEIKNKTARIKNYSNTLFFRTLDKNIATIKKSKDDIFNTIARFEEAKLLKN